MRTDYYCNVTKLFRFGLYLLRSYRSELLTSHSLKIIGCVAFIHYLNSEHCLDYVLHCHDTAHAAIFICYYRTLLSTKKWTGLKIK